MKNYMLSEVIAHCKKMRKEYGEMACRECDKEFHLSVCSELSPRDWDKQSNIEPREMRHVTRLLYVEDGSIDVEELEPMLPDNIKIVTYRQGSQKPELANLFTYPDAFLAELKGEKE